MRARNWEDYFGDEAASVAQITPRGEISATATPTPGVLAPGEGEDRIAVNLVMGQTYTFNMRGAVGGVSDPYLFLVGMDDATLIAQDDDGGAGISSQITYTATATGTYYLYATSWDFAVTGVEADLGAYTINTWSPDADVPGSTNVPASIATAQSLGLGTYYGNIDVPGDNDYFALTVTAGQVYAINFSGGISGGSDLNGEMGETLARLTLYNAAGTQLATNFNYESAVGYFSATTSGTIYLRVANTTVAGVPARAGGYTLDVSETTPDLTRDPREAFIWDSADNVVPREGDGNVVHLFRPVGRKPDAGRSQPRLAAEPDRCSHARPGQRLLPGHRLRLCHHQ